MSLLESQSAPFKRSSVADSLRRRIVTGVLLPGMKLPSREELSREFRVSLDTTQRAVEELKHQQFLFARRKAGTFVAEHPPHLFHYGLVFQPARTESNYLRAFAEAADSFERDGP